VYTVSAPYARDHAAVTTNAMTILAIPRNTRISDFQLTLLDGFLPRRFGASRPDVAQIFKRSGVFY
jgi:hypothetical protein